MGEYAMTQETPDSWLDAILTPSALRALFRIMGNKEKKEQLLKVMLVRAFYAGMDEADKFRNDAAAAMRAENSIPLKLATSRQLRNPPI
jgi:hypothetical protein